MTQLDQSIRVARSAGTRQEAFYGKEIVLADRNVVESEADSIYASAKEEDVAFLVVGDPLCATTHTDLIIRARELGIKVTRDVRYVTDTFARMNRMYSGIGGGCLSFG